MGDVDGDGFPELAQPEIRGLAEDAPWVQWEHPFEVVVYTLRSPTTPDKPPVAQHITEVRDGMGLFQRVTYAPLTKDSVYTPGTGCTLPQRCLRNGLTVVESLKQFNAGNPVEGDRDVYYKYEDARTDIRGRGFLGFRCVTSTELPRNKEIKTCYRQHDAWDIPLKKACPGYAYPYAGLPTSVSIKQHVAGALYRFTSTSFEYDTPPVWGPGHTYRVSQRAMNQWVAEGPRDALVGPGSEMIRLRQRVENTFDAFGNLREQTARVYRGNRTTADFETRRFNQWMAHDMERWLIARLLSVDIQTIRAGEQMQKRVTDYDYVPNTLSVSSLTVRRADDTEDVELVTSYDRDATGMIIGVARSDAFGNERAELIEYESHRTFPTRLTNALGQVTILVPHPSTGQVLMVRDPNGIDYQWSFDWAGRPRGSQAPDGSFTEFWYGTGAELTAVIGAEPRHGPFALLTTDNRGDSGLA